MQLKANDEVRRKSSVAIYVEVFLSENEIYGIEVKNGMVILRGHFAKPLEVPVHTDTAPAKFKATTVRLSQDGAVQETGIRGTHTILRLDSNESATLGAQ